MVKFIDNNGVSYLWNRVKTWVAGVLPTKTSQLSNDSGYLTSADLNGYAPKASPAFTGAPTAPTAADGTNTTQIATTAFVQSAVTAAKAGVAVFRGTINDAAVITGAEYKLGWYWVVKTAGTYVGEACEVGDMIFAIADKGAAYQASDFSVVQNNMDLRPMTNAEIDAVTTD